MKHRILFTLLMLFTSVGWMNIHGQVVLTSNGTKDVVVQLGQKVSVETATASEVELSNDGKSVTIKQGYTEQVTIKASAAPTQIKVDGNLTSLSVTANSLKSLTFGSGNYVKDLTVVSTSLETLTCSGLGMESLTLTDASALKTLNASNNKLSSLTFPTTPILEDVNLSKNSFASLTVSSLTKLEKLNVSDNLLTDLDASALKALGELNLSGNKIVKLTKEPGNAKCTITWGVQTITIPSSGTPPTPYNTPANKGFDIRTLIKDAGITTVAEPVYSNVSWQVKDGTVYVEDNGKTAHKQSGAWVNEYRFYDSATKSYVKGIYQCTLTTGNRTYKITDLEVWAATFTLKGTSLNTNATDGFQVSINGAAAVDVKDNLVKQGQTLVFSVKPAEGFSSIAEYTIKGMDPAIQGQEKPYRGASFTCVVNGKYTSQSESVEPKIEAVVLPNGHQVVYQDKEQAGGSFTVEKVSGTTTSEIKSGEEIVTGEKLQIKIKPKTGYDFKLIINGENKTEKVLKTEQGGYTYIEEIKSDSYMDSKNPQSITISVTYSNSSVKASVQVDGKSLSDTNTPYVKDKKVTLQKQDGTSVNIKDGNAVKILPHTSYQAIFTLGVNDKKAYRLRDITINGKEPISISKDLQADKNMKYTVVFNVEESDVVLSITTRALKTAKVVAENQTQVYDGKAKLVLFSTNPEGLTDNVEVKYTNITNGGSIDMGTTPPVDAGTYTAAFTFKENEVYIGETTSTSSVTLTISKASLKIEKAPTVTVNRDGTYDITGGLVTFNGKEVKGTFNTDKDKPDVAGKSHAVGVTFTPELPADKANYEAAKMTVNVIVGNDPLDLSKVSMVTLPTSYSIQWLNGDKPVNISTDGFAEGTELTAIITYPKGTNGVSLELTSAHSASVVTKVDAKSVDGTLVYTVTIKGDTELKVKAGTGDTYTIVLKDQSVKYSGQPQPYDKENGLLISDKNGNTVTLTSISSKMKVTYTDAAGNQVVEPIDAGTYTVQVTIAADSEKGYIESTASKAALKIEKVQPLVYKWPVASVIAKGQALALSDLTGGSVSIPGTFTWKNGAETFSVAGEYRRPVVFTPSEKYQKNYLSVETRGGEDLSGTGEDNQWVKFTVSNLQIVTFSQKPEGTITVVNQKGENLTTGSPITEGDVLTINATPKENFKLKSITVNGVDYTSSYKVGSSSVAIEATFEVLVPEPEEPEIDPDSQYAVTLPERNAIRGVIINKPGVNVVKHKDPFSFTLSTLAADASKVIVQVNGTELKPEEGIYTIESVTDNTIVSISLPTPTALEVAVEKTTKNKKGYLMGTVQVEGPIDGKYYYGDELTLVAYPESGVTFGGWSDDKSEKDRLRTLVITEGVTIKPLFSGTPTDIEEIETAEIYGSEGCIILRGIGEANVTIVSMDGRARKQTVSGDTQIYTAAGIYGVILEQGSEVKRVKVIVR